MAEPDDLGALGIDIDPENIPYASEANKALDAEVKKKEAELQQVEDKLEADGERVKIMTDHLINVQQELVNTQQLVDAKKREIESEEHMKALTNRQLGRLKAETLRLQKLVDDQQDHINSLSNELMRGNEKLDQFKLEMNWNQEELEQWAIAARQKEEDEMTLLKYKRADDSKVRELTLAVEKLAVENSSRRKELADEVTETQARQIEMDKTAELFRQLHEERRKLISQWEDAVKSMRMRDAQLERLGEEFASNMSKKRTKTDKLKEKKKQYEDAETENGKLEQTISTTDRQLVRARLDFMNVKSELTGFKDEVEVLKNQLDACETEKNNTKNKLQVLAKSLEGRKEKHTVMHRSLIHHERALEMEDQNTKDKDVLSTEAERMHAEVVQSLRQVEKDMKMAKDNLFKESQELYRLRAEEATTLGEISGAQSAIKNLQFQISRLDQERQRQQELLYAVDFQSQLMQRKVARVSGERTVEEKEEFNRKVEKLDKDMDEQKSLHAILSTQNKRQDAELKTAQRSLANIKKETEGMKGTMEELELQNTIMNRSVANVVKVKEESLMQHDILKLEVKRLRQQLNAKTENLYGLENRKQQLQISMEEREKEIEVHQEVLKAQLRAQQEEKHKTGIELAERKQKIYNLKMKYENVVNKVKKEDGEEPKSQAYYVLKAAQDKEELQRKGDELYDKIQRAEREIRALENTLGHLVMRNKKYKENFQTANQQNQTELEEKQMLEEQSRAANEVLFRKKKQLGQLEKEEQQDAARYEELQTELAALSEQLQELGSARDVLRLDIEAQQPKMERAQQTLEVSRQRAVDAGVEMGAESAPTLDIESRNLKDQSQSFLYALGNALQDYPEDVLPLFEQVCQDKGVVGPSRPPSAGSAALSRAGSSRSSLQLGSARMPPPPAAGS